VEYRNLCVRKVELVHVNNQDDRKLDEFTALVSAHAQVIVMRAGRVEYAIPTCARCRTTGPSAGRIPAGFCGRSCAGDGVNVLRKENVDEGSSPEMLEWFYSKPRAT